jgi:two-component system, cell cycle response regulator
MRSARATPWPALASLGALSAWVLGFELTVAPSWNDALPFRGIALDIAFALAGLLLIARGQTRERGWILIGAGALCWAAGDVYWTLGLADLKNPPIPSWADAGYLAFCPLTFAGILALVRRRARTAPRTLAADALAAALAIGAVSAALVVQPVLATAQGGPLGVATNLAYPLTDLLLLGVLVGAIALGGWRLVRTWLLLAASVMAFWVADSLYLITIAKGTYQLDAWFNGLWYLTPVLAGWAAWLPQGPGAATGEIPKGVRGIVLPLVFAFAAIGTLVWSSLDDVGPLAVGLASASLLVVMVRLALTWRENSTLLRASQEEAVTDALTGLANRRALAIDLDRRMPGADDGRPLVLVLLDLDGFKHYNDTFGHPAGDALLQRLGRNLELCLVGRGTAYRMGGDEFCALIEPGAEVAAPIIAAAAAALSDHGEGFTIGCSYGSIVLPREAQDAESALRIADRRMYAQKRGGRLSASQQSKDVLLRALAERNPQLGAHLRDVADLAEAVATACSLPAKEIEQIRHAAELHDVGKMAVPDAILNKPGPLDDDEWTFVRRHPIIGERIIIAAPALSHVGALVRSSHEHFDGTGYPDGLAGQDIPFGSRIVAVCDAFDAMTSDRPYRAAMAPEAALAELRRRAGTQFDPVVVETFCAVWARLAERSVHAA